MTKNFVGELFKLWITYPTYVVNWRIPSQTDRLRLSSAISVPNARLMDSIQGRFLAVAFLMAVYNSSSKRALSSV